MGFGWGEILLIILLALLIFGARRIPELARSFGKGVREFKKGLNDTQDGTDPSKDERKKK